MNAPYRISGIGLIAPGIGSLEQLRTAALLRTPGSAPKRVDAVPPPEGMTPREQRRMANLTKLALYAADSCRKMDPFSGEKNGLYVGLTHGATGFLREFHGFLFDYGPEMCSPNAFSNGVSNAPLAAVSKVMNIRGGGFTLVDFENCGLKALATAAIDLDLGNYESCCVGAAEEYSELVEEVYLENGLYRGGGEAVSLPLPGGTGFGVSEGSVFLSMRSTAACSGGCGYRPVEEPSELESIADVIISAAGAGPNDAAELEHLKMLRSGGHGVKGVLFPKAFLGETFGASTLFALAAGFDMIVNNAEYPQLPAHPELGAMPDRISGVQAVLISGVDRTGEFVSALLTR
ncbi:MAG: hypothetical protein JW913_17525 [Chitinispirillaceae bacterium]|nr:hypothetical protein [Chitinispirillaceae bacterium]